MEQIGIDSSAGTLYRQGCLVILLHRFLFRGLSVSRPMIQVLFLLSLSSLDLSPVGLYWTFVAPMSPPYDVRFFQGLLIVTQAHPRFMYFDRYVPRWPLAYRHYQYCCGIIYP